MARKASQNTEVTETVGNQTGSVMAYPEKTEPAQTPVYSVRELAVNAKKIFGTRQECVEVALIVAGKTQYAVDEAKDIVEKFLNKEVK